jgi:hypothetical protein
MSATIIGFPRPIHAARQISRGGPLVQPLPDELLVPDDAELRMFDLAMSNRWMELPPAHAETCSSNSNEPGSSAEGPGDSAGEATPQDITAELRSLAGSMRDIAGAIETLRMTADRIADRVRALQSSSTTA